RLPHRRAQARGLLSRLRAQRPRPVRWALHDRDGRREPPRHQAPRDLRPRDRVPPATDRTVTPPNEPTAPRNMSSARFIVFEGPEGSGKSTQIARLADRLRSLGRDPLVTREPGGTPAGEAVRSVLLDPRYHIGPLAEFLLYAACRAQHVEDVIAPALASGRDVVSDRFGGASVAYQGHGRGLDLDLVHDVNRRAMAGVRPDLTLLLDLDPADGLRRAAARAGHDRLESESLAFHLRVRDGFLEQARHDPTWHVIDASGSEEAVAADVWEAVARLLANDLGKTGP